MDAGIARLIKENFPEAYEADIQTKRGDRSKLGTCSYGIHRLKTRDFVVINAYTQYDWDGEGVLVDYDAVRSCMQWVKVHFSGKRIGLPKIGAGLARGDWSVINKIITEELRGEDVTLVLKQK